MQFTLITTTDQDKRVKRTVNSFTKKIKIDKQKKWGTGNAYLISCTLSQALYIAANVCSGSDLFKAPVDIITPFDNDLLCQEEN